MKKLLFVTTLLASLVSSFAFAKSGVSVGVAASWLDVDQEFGNSDFLGSDDDTFLPTVRGGYNFDLDGILLRPSVSYTIGDVEIYDKDGSGDSSDLSNIFTIEGDVGYNFVDNFAAFLTVGLVSAKLERKVASVKTEDRESDLLYGAGLEFGVSDNIDLNVRYQRYELDYATVSRTDIEVEVDTVKLGVAYNF